MRLVDQWPKRGDALAKAPADPELVASRDRLDEIEMQPWMEASGHRTGGFQTSSKVFGSANGASRDQLGAERLQPRSVLIGASIDAGFDDD